MIHCNAKIYLRYLTFGFLPFLPFPRCSSPDSVANDLKMRNIMTGKNYVNFIEKCDNESSCSDTESADNLFLSAADEEMLADLLAKTYSNNQRPKDSQLKDQFDDGSAFNQSSDHSFSGFEACITNDLDRKKAKRSSSSSTVPAKRGRPRQKTEPRPIELYDSSDDTSSRGTLDSIIPPPKDFRGSNNPFVDEHKSNGSLPAASTPKNGTSVSNFGFSISGSTAGNSSLGSKSENGVRMVRTVKRRLSARDIRIGPNQEVKRRKIKKREGEVEVRNRLILTKTKFLNPVVY